VMVSLTGYTGRLSGPDDPRVAGIRARNGDAVDVSLSWSCPIGAIVRTTLLEPDARSDGSQTVVIVPPLAGSTSHSSQPC